MPALHHLRGFYEPFSSISHLFGAALFLVLGILLLRRARRDKARMAFLSVYAAACVTLFALSGVYHMMIKGGTASRVMLRLDLAGIYVLIAGTYTPVHGLLFRGLMRWGPLLAVYIVSAAGIVLRTAFTYCVPESVGLVLYLGLGWIGTVSGFLLWRRYGLAFILPLLLGGIVYSAGAVTDYFGWPVVVSGIIQSHEVWHLAVLAGALSHFAFIWRFSGERTER